MRCNRHGRGDDCVHALSQFSKNLDVRGWTTWTETGSLGPFSPNTKLDDGHEKFVYNFWIVALIFQLSTNNNPPNY
jgi:hypothetical protein